MAFSSLRLVWALTVEDADDEELVVPRPAAAAAAAAAEVEVEEYAPLGEEEDVKGDGKRDKLW